MRILVQTQPIRLGETDVTLGYAVNQRGPQDRVSYCLVLVNVLPEMAERHSVTYQCRYEQTGSREMVDLNGRRVDALRISRWMTSGASTVAIGVRQAAWRGQVDYSCAFTGDPSAPGFRWDALRRYCGYRPLRESADPQWVTQPTEMCRFPLATRCFGLDAADEPVFVLRAEAGNTAAYAFNPVNPGFPSAASRTVILSNDALDSVCVGTGLSDGSIRPTTLIRGNDGIDIHAHGIGGPDRRAVKRRTCPLVALQVSREEAFDDMLCLPMPVVVYGDGLMAQEPSCSTVHSDGIPDAWQTLSDERRVALLPMITSFSTKHRILSVGEKAWIFYACPGTELVKNNSRRLLWELPSTTDVGNADMVLRCITRSAVGQLCALWARFLLDFRQDAEAMLDAATSLDGLRAATVTFLRTHDYSGAANWHDSVWPTVAEDPAGTPHWIVPHLQRCSGCNQPRSTFPIVVSRSVMRRSGRVHSLPPLHPGQDPDDTTIRICADCRQGSGIYARANRGRWLGMCSCCRGVMQLPATRLANSANQVCQQCIDDGLVQPCHTCGGITTRTPQMLRAGRQYCPTCFEAVGRALNSYSYKPRPVFQRGASDKFNDLYFGTEIELEFPRDTELTQAAAAVVDDPACSDWIYAKTDGSLSHGVEFVTHPLRFDWILENEEKVKKFFHIIQRLCGRAGSSCGGHVHVTRDWFTPLALVRYQQLVYRHRPFWLEISGRDSESRYASFSPNWREMTKLATGAQEIKDQRYSAINATPRTMESRFWASYDQYSDWRAVMETQWLMCMFSREDGPIRPSKDAFLAYVETMSRKMKLHDVRELMGLPKLKEPDPKWLGTAKKKDRLACVPKG